MRSMSYSYMFRFPHQGLMGTGGILIVSQLRNIILGTENSIKLFILCGYILQGVEVE